MAQTLEEYVADFLRSDDVRRYVRASLNSNKAASGNSNIVGKARATAAVNELADILRQEIENSPELENDNPMFQDHAKKRLLKAIVTRVYYNDLHETWMGEVYFDRNKVKGWSWLKDDPDYNYDFPIYLPLLLNNGYSAQRQVYTTMFGKRVGSMQHRKPSHFIQRAKEEFDKRHVGDGLSVFVHGYYLDDYDWRSINYTMFL